MNAIFENLEFKGYFLPGMPKLRETFYIFMCLLKDQAPKVFNSLKKIELVPTMFASQWFMTLFTVGFPIEFTLRVYDAFFTEGEKILY